VIICLTSSLVAWSVYAWDVQDYVVVSHLHTVYHISYRKAYLYYTFQIIFKFTAPINIKN